MKVGLVTGGRWHNEPYLFLKKNGIKVVLFDDSKNCFLKKKYNLKNFKLNSMKHFSNIPFWSPCNDLGSVLSDYYNKKRFTKIKTRTNQLNQKYFDKKTFSNTLNKKIIFKNKKYLLKSRSGSGSREIEFWNGKSYNTKKYYLEEYLKGFEFSVEVVSNKSKHQIFAISLRVLKKIKSAIAILTFSHSSKFKKFIQEFIEKHLNNHKVINGVSHLELIINHEKKLKIIDTNLRCPGAGLTDYFYTMLTKKNLFEIDYNILLRNSKYNTYKTNFKNGIILFDHKKLNNFNQNLQNIFKYSNYHKLELNEFAKQDEEIDINRKGIAVKKFKSQKDLIKFCKKIFKKKDYKQLLEFKYFYNKNFS